MAAERHHHGVVPGRGKGKNPRSPRNRASIPKNEPPQFFHALAKTCPIAAERGSHDVETDGSESDRELLGRYSASGGDAPFRILVDRYSGLVFHTARRTLGDAALAQDVSQRVFVSLAKKAEQVARGEAPLPSWLHRATLLKAKAELRSESRHARRKEALMNAPVLGTSIGKTTTSLFAVKKTTVAAVSATVLLCGVPLAYQQTRIQKLEARVANSVPLAELSPRSHPTDSRGHSQVSYLQRLARDLKSQSSDTAFSTLLGYVSMRNKYWRKSAAWIESLNLSDEEKLRVAKGLRGLGDDGVDGSPEPTQWIADYLPPSKERSFILWLSVRHGVWGAMDQPAAEAFLRKNSIDEAEMARLESEGFLRPY
jgi:DNA-directed RNA polymerase specialized sigma24 family protein